MSETKLRELRAARGVPKRQLTILEKFVAELSPHTDIYVVEARFETLPSIREHFEAAQGELERCDEKESQQPDDGQLTEREEFENRFIQVKARLQRFLRESPNLTSPFNPSHNSTVVDMSSDLPKLDVPDFFGSYKEYPSFIDIFDTLVHDNPSRQLTNVRKLGILMGACKGRAREVIKHLALTNENYEVARTVLRERFANPRLNFEQCINCMWDLPKATNSRSLRTLADTIFSQLRALERLGTKEQIVDGILIHMILDKVDSTTRTKWEEHQASSKEIPDGDDFMRFLDKRCTVWEAIDASKTPPHQASSSFRQQPSETQKRTYVTQSSVVLCLCDRNCENILDCNNFRDLPPKQKFFKAKELNLCYSCLDVLHKDPCEAPPCDHCGKPHHTTLHYGKIRNGHFKPSGETGNTTQSNLSIAVKQTADERKIINTRTWVDFNKSYCFLATAIILVKNSMNQYVPLRALFDGAAQAAFITEKAAKLLGVADVNTHVELTGIHGTRKVLRKAIKIEFKAAFSDFMGEFYLPVNPYYCDNHPARKINVENWKIPDNIRLADPNFNVPGSVDVLLNAHTTYEWQSMGQFKLGDGMPILQKTLLGWVVVGNYNSFNKDTRSNNITLSAPLDELITRFWTLENRQVECVKPTPEEAKCEEHYRQNVSRRPDGRFVVRLPFRRDPSCLGTSFAMAKNRFVSLQSKLKRDRDVSEAYQAFMDEYQQLGHCKPASTLWEGPSYYIPHFHVTNPGSTTTALRVVFDASAATNTGLSLNDIMMVGAAQQPHLFKHVMSFRMNKIALTGDISKMFRQIDVAEEDQHFQRILWTNQKGQLIDLQLTTLTYGTASAPFLATRVLKHLADDETELLTGAEAIRNHMYVDDLLTGADTVTETVKLYEEVRQVLAKGQLPIRKFCSNSCDVMKAIPTELHGSRLRVGDKDVVKTLGVLWLPEQDVFTFHHEPSNKPLTKRAIISEVSSIFDILGFISPVTVLGKLLIQRLWTLKVDWDESLPQSEVTSWLKLKEEFRQIDQITLPRYVLSQGRMTNVTLHGFGDASKLAYAAVFYLRTEDDANNVTVRMLCSKTRVAPLKTITLPRLELLSGQLLATLYTDVKPLLTLPISQTFLWLDASIALTWIQASPHKWTSFVATRVTKIQDMTSECQWRHVRSEDNPADIASRGMLPSKLANNTLWFEGPQFLRSPSQQWPNRFMKPESIPETATQHKVLLTAMVEPDLVSQSKLQSWLPIQATFGYVHRFITNIRAKTSQAPPSSIIRQETHESKPKPSDGGCPSNGEYPRNLLKKKDTRSSLSQEHQTPKLSAVEMEMGLRTAIKIIQLHKFNDVINALQSKSPLPKERKEIAKLHPFIDPEGLIRVGGRLGHASDMEVNAKFPILLPDHPFTRSLFIHTHVTMMHAGPQAMMGTIYQKFWPLKGKIIANNTYRRCLRCQWISPKPATQLMGPLPRCRVSVADRPFVSTGVDYFEPLWVSQPGRGRKPLRAYGCVFVCMTTKAIHLELVDDLTTPGFLNAFSRFVARRGLPSEMFSDNGRNFVGARNLIYDNQTRFNTEDHWQAVFEWCKNKGIIWHFTPPRTPHHGGLWEAAVKSVKYHLIRVLGQTSLYRAEMETVMATVEAILNSRPLVPVTPHPEDGSPLTPAHFIIGEPIKSLPEPYLADFSLNHLERYKRVIAAKQLFWKKWSHEYIHTLMNRYKWNEDKPNIKEDDYVLLVDKNTKPLTWNWGKVESVQQATDGKVRSATVRTTNGTYKRGITELCPLPFDDIEPSV